MKIVTKQSPKGPTAEWNLGNYLDNLPPIVIKEGNKVPIEAPETSKQVFHIEGHTGLWYKGEEMSNGLKEGYVVEHLLQDKTRFVEQGTIVEIPKWIV